MARKYSIERFPTNKNQYMLRIKTPKKTKIIYPFESEEKAKQYLGVLKEVDKTKAWLKTFD